MFEKVGQVAEQVATSVSRRQFLGRFGQGALAVAAAMGGLLALPAIAQAGGRLCGPLSDLECQGHTFGSPCMIRGGGTGNCKNIGGARATCTCA